MISTAAAPSLICEELAAVMTPSGLNTVFSPAIFSMLVSARIPSSRVICAWPDSVSTVTGAISLQKRPSAVARAARRWLSRLKASNSPRLICQRSAIISALMPWLKATLWYRRITPGPNGSPGPAPFDPIGTRVMDSTPQAMAIS